MQISFRWLGNAGFEFQLGNTILLVDPFLTRPRQTQVYFGSAAVDRQAINEHVKACSHILVSHAHFDHFMDVPEIAYAPARWCTARPIPANWRANWGFLKPDPSNFSQVMNLTIDEY